MVCVSTRERRSKSEDQKTELMKLLGDLCSIELLNNKGLGRHLHRAGEDQGRAHPVDRRDQGISLAGHRRPGAQEAQDRLQR